MKNKIFFKKIILSKTSICKLLLRFVRIPPLLLLLLSYFGFLGGLATSYSSTDIGIDGLWRRALIGIDLLLYLKYNSNLNIQLKTEKKRFANVPA